MHKNIEDLWLSSIGFGEIANSIWSCNLVESVPTNNYHILREGILPRIVSRFSSEDDGLASST